MSFGLVKHNNNSISAITSAGQLAQGKMTLLQTQTASSSASISFTSNIDSTYPIYVFKFINIHPSSSGEFTVNFSSDTGSNYNVTKTTQVFYAYHKEDGSNTTLTHSDNEDLAQSTSFQNLTVASQIGLDNDECASGEMYLFNPASTTAVKHFMSEINYVDNSSTPFCLRCHVAGYNNTTSAIDGVQFKMDSGNLDSGVIKMFGIKGS